MNELVSAIREVAGLATRIFPMPAIIAAVVFVGGAIWYSLRGRKQ